MADPTPAPDTLLRLRPLPCRPRRNPHDAWWLEVPHERRLALLLKHLLRRYGYRCVRIRDVPPGATEEPPC